MAFWQIEDTEETAPDTMAGFKGLNLKRNSSYRDHRIVYVDDEGNARPEYNKPEDLPRGLGKGTARLGEPGGPEVEIEVAADGETLFPIRVWMPSTAFTLFNYAKVNGISAHGDVMSFLWDYAQVGFMRQHGLGLSLVELPTDGDKTGQRFEALEKDMGDIKSALSKLSPAKAPAAKAQVKSPATAREDEQDK